jgi:hypothetical protein
MKTKLFIILLTYLSYFIPTAYAQDIIVQTIGADIRAQVTDVGTQVVKYKKFDNLGGPIYEIEASKVFMITYKNGDKDIFEKSPNTNKIQIRHVPNPKKEIKQDTEQKTLVTDVQQGTASGGGTTASGGGTTASGGGTTASGTAPVVKPPVPVVKPPVQEKKTTVQEEKPPVQEKKPPVQEEKPPVQEKNNPSAQEQFNYGMRYEKGEDGTPQDNQKAADWYLKAALQGHADAQYRLGLLCATVKGLRIKTQEDFTMNGNGQFVNKDGLSMAEATALHWWRKAAEQGHAEAKAKLQSRESTESNQTTETAEQDVTKPKPVPGSTGTLQVDGGTYSVYISEIGENASRNTFVKIYGTDDKGKNIGNLFIRDDKIIPPVWMKIVVDGETLSAEDITAGYGYSFTFNTGQKPEKIIVYSPDNDKESVTFDGKTKKVVTLAVAPPVK